MSTIHPDKDYEEEVGDPRDRLKTLPKKQSKVYVLVQDEIDYWKVEIEKKESVETHNRLDRDRKELEKNIDKTMDKIKKWKDERKNET